jgi:hypothetical protein
VVVVRTMVQSRLYDRIAGGSSLYNGSQQIVDDWWQLVQWLSMTNDNVQYCILQQLVWDMYSF